MYPIRRVSLLAFVMLVPLVTLGMAGNGCPNATGLAPGTATVEPLAGEWTLTRGDVKVMLSWTINGGGTKEEDSVTTQLETLNAADYPSQLKPLIDQWNAGLSDLNARLDAAMPSVVWVSFPHFGVMRITNAADASKMVEGAIDGAAQYIFIGDVSGATVGDDQGAGALFQASSITGRFERSALTTEGLIARTLVMFANGTGGSSIALTAQIVVDYTGTRTGDLPAGNGG